MWSLSRSSVEERKFPPGRPPQLSFFDVEAFDEQPRGDETQLKPQRSLHCSEVSKIVINRPWSVPATTGNSNNVACNSGNRAAFLHR